MSVADVPMLDDDGTPLDVIALCGLSLSCIVGMYPNERARPQELCVDVALGLDTRAAARGGGLKETIDYARLAGELAFLLESGRFWLLETAAEALCRFVLAPAPHDAPRANAVAARVRLTKPAALHGRATPSLEVLRRAREVAPVVEQAEGGPREVLFASKSCRITRLELAAGARLPAHAPEDDAELALSSGLLVDGAALDAGMALFWPAGAVRAYANPTGAPRTLLRVERPVRTADERPATRVEKPFFAADGDGPSYG